MGWAWEHVPRPVVACKLDEHGGEKEQRHRELFRAMAAELEAAIKVVAAKPEYAEIIGYTFFDGE